MAGIEFRARAIATEQHNRIRGLSGYKGNTNRNEEVLQEYFSGEEILSKRLHHSTPHVNSGTGEKDSFPIGSLSTTQLQAMC